jgi:fructose-bisphosphate aldolase class I
MNQQQLDRIKNTAGFIAALDQSGGSTPKALRAYGLDESHYSSTDEMFDLIHAMRTRIMTSAGFGGDRIMGAILFEMTMDRSVLGKGSADYLWSEKGVVPFLKIDKGMVAEDDGVQLLKPMPELDALCQRAVAKGVFGTKMRSVIKHASASGIKAVVKQQFAIGRQILGHGLVPIIEPEVDIHSTTKAEAERLLRAAILSELDAMADGQPVMLKLTLPEEDDFYRALVEHPKVLKVVALSGGYSREEANGRLSRNRGVVASFSRALTEGLSAPLQDEQFDATLNTSIQSIFDASRT